MNSINMNVNKQRVLTISTGLLLISALAFAGCGQSSETITLSGGEFGYDNVPISVETEPGRWSDGTALCLESGGVSVAGQVEERMDGSSAIWFLAQVPAGESVTYQVTENGDCHGILFNWAETGERVVTLEAGGMPVLEYVHPVYDSENVEDTKKPFHHVYAPSGDRRITKGVGGLYSHHRGIFFGYNQTRVGEESYDIWHAYDGERSEHEQIEKEWAGPVFGGHELTIHWKGYEGETFAIETRRLRAFQVSSDRTVIDLETTLRSVAGEIELDGDLQHAGVQFRTAQYVADNSNQTRYFRPEPWTDHPADEELEDIERFVDLPWNAFQFVIEEDDYTVGYIRHSENPSGGQFSERLYGRFGEFIPTVIDEENPLTLRYRFLIMEGHEVSRETLNSFAAGFQE
ncbi:MAG: DUF6807 family protein [Balneolaceae bacterium]